MKISYNAKRKLFWLLLCDSKIPLSIRQISPPFLLRNPHIGILWCTVNFGLKIFAPIRCGDHEMIFGHGNIMRLFISTYRPLALCDLLLLHENWKVGTHPRWIWYNCDEISPMHDIPSPTSVFFSPSQNGQTNRKSHRRWCVMFCRHASCCCCVVWGSWWCSDPCCYHLCPCCCSS